MGSCAEDTAGGQGTNSSIFIEERAPDESLPTKPRGRFNSNEVVDQRTGTTISMVLQAAERRAPTPLLWQSREDDEQLARLPRSELLLGVRTANGAAVRTNPRADEARRIERIQCDQIKEQVTSAAQRCTALDCLLVVCAAAQAQANCATLPDWFKLHLQALAANKQPHDLLVGHDRTWLHRHVGQICTAAGVPKVPTHGLRGTHSDLALVAASTPLAVSQALGHESVSTTFKHYADANLAEQNDHQRATAALAPN